MIKLNIYIYIFFTFIIKVITNINTEKYIRQVIKKFQEDKQYEILFDPCNPTVCTGCDRQVFFLIYIFLINIMFDNTIPNL